MNVFLKHPFLAALFVIAGAALAFASSVTEPVFSPTSVKAVFLEQFTEGWNNTWKSSEAKKIIPRDKSAVDGAEDQPEHQEFQFNGVWSVEEPSVYPGIKGDQGLVVKSPATHHAISAAFNSLLDPKGKTLVVQYEVKFQNLLECGGAYLKLLTKQSKPFDAKKFDDKYPYTIMFGPDKCGATNKVHFIFRHKNPLTGEYEEKHLKTPPPATISKLSTLYTLIVHPDNSYVININNEKVASGSLLEDFLPAVNPPKEIDDMTDVKPANWVDNPKIADPKATKPADWNEDAPMYIEDLEATKPDNWYENESAMIDDPESVKPAEWSDEDDGDWIPNQIPNPKCAGAAGCGPWEVPMKKNPEYKGKWFAPMIDNPDYIGPWERRKIPNPDAFEDLTPANFEPMYAVGFELWTIQNDILFDNILICHSEEDAKEFASKTWAVKYAIEKALQEETELANKEEEEGEVKDATRVESAFEDIVSKVLEVVDDLQDNPKEALTKHSTILVGAFASLVIVLVLLKKLLFGVPKKSDKITADVGEKKKKDIAVPDVKGKESTKDSPKEATKENNPKASNAPVSSDGSLKSRVK